MITNCNTSDYKWIWLWNKSVSIDFENSSTIHLQMKFSHVLCFALASVIAKW